MLRHFTLEAYRSFLSLSYSRRYFAALSAGSAVSQFGSMSVAAAGPLLVLSETGSPVSAGYVTAASVLPSFILHVPAGALADRFDRRTVMWASQLVRIVSALVTCFCLLSMSFSVPLLAAAAVVDGSCAILYEVAESAAVPELVSKESLSMAIGSNEAKLNASMLLGRPMGGALLAVNPVMPYFIGACTSLFPVVTLAVLRRPGESERRPAGPRRRGRGEPGPPRVEVAEREDGEGQGGAGDRGALRHAFGLVVNDAFSCAVLAACFLANFFFQVIVLLQILLAERAGMPSYVVGLLLSFSGIGGFVGAIISPFILRRLSPSVSVLLSVLAWVPLVWMSTALVNPAIGLLGWGLCSAVGTPITIALKTHQANEVPAESLGLITGITRLLSVGAVALGALSGGWIIHLLGPGLTAIVADAVFVVIALVVLQMLHDEALLVLASIKRAVHAAGSFVLRGAIPGPRPREVAPDDSSPTADQCDPSRNSEPEDSPERGDLGESPQYVDARKSPEPPRAVEDWPRPTPGQIEAAVQSRLRVELGDHERRTVGLVGARDPKVTAEDPRRSVPIADLVRSVSGDAVSGGSVTS
ncbi:MFS transporter [Actinomadura sp. NTSP31]|uniref:MFS transporter n=1 Tax=Actinomadura sp. NTSP31 TaxID=1735447 RepID=UPI0035C1D2A8